MSINDQQRRALAFLTRTYRATIHNATTWDEPGIMAALARVRGLDVGTVVMAAMRCAADASIKTPAMIGDPASSVYRERLGPAQARRHASPATACRTCGRDYGPDCCDRPSDRPEPAADPTAQAATARAALKRGHW